MKKLKKQGISKIHFVEDDSILIHVTITGRCNARCEGCINSTITNTHAPGKSRDSITTFQEADPERDTAMIQNLAMRYPERMVTVCFYGGEPLLAPEKMEEIRVRLDSSAIKNRLRYMIYTNGELIEQTLRRYPDLILKNWLMSVSIDGDAAQHNRVRPGTDLQRMTENLKALRNGASFKGHVLMWSTLREDQSLGRCFDEFMRLHEKNLIDHWFWHWVETREPFNHIDQYCLQYEKHLTGIMNAFADKLETGIVLPIAHINELVLYLLTGKERRHTCCGVELGRNFDLVDGTVRMCVDFPPETGLGDINDETSVFKRRDLLALTGYTKDLGCSKCGVYFYCGGRCPVQAIYGGLARTRQYCRLMRLHVGAVKKYLPRIKAALAVHRISLQDLYDRSAFITRYTDVIP
jgi:uncharacterized protein